MLRRILFNFNLHSSHEYTLKYFGREEIEQEGYYCQFCDPQKKGNYINIVMKIAI